MWPNPVECYLTLCTADKIFFNLPCTIRICRKYTWLEYIKPATMVKMTHYSGIGAIGSVNLWCFQPSPFLLVISTITWQVSATIEWQEHTEPKNNRWSHCDEGNLHQGAFQINFWGCIPLICVCCCSWSESWWCRGDNERKIDQRLV